MRSHDLCRADLHPLPSLDGGGCTGARINELTPLIAADFIKRDGIWMIRIRGANAKTRSYRAVPLHSHLIEQGLLDYAQSRGKRPLFYDPARSRGAKDSNPHHLSARLKKLVYAGAEERLNSIDNRRQDSRLSSF